MLTTNQTLVAASIALALAACVCAALRWLRNDNTTATVSNNAKLATAASVLLAVAAVMALLGGKYGSALIWFTLGAGNFTASTDLRRRAAILRKEERRRAEQRTAALAAEYGLPMLNLGHTSKNPDLT